MEGDGNPVEPRRGPTRSRSKTGAATTTPSGRTLRSATAAQDPLHWLTMAECGPARLHSGSKTEDLMHEGPLRRHVVGGHGAPLSLGQHRHRLHPGQGAPSRPEALEPEHRPGPALHAAVVLLDQVVVPAAAAVAGEAPQLAVAL